MSRRVGSLIAAISFFFWCSDGGAETQEYQIRRLIYLSTSCGIQSLKSVDSAPGRERFKATCGNTSAYPDGIEVLCLDPEDDRSCKVLTAPHYFRQLELLRPSAP